MSALKRELLLDILSWEHRLELLALRTYRQWIPSVQEAVLPTLAASMTLPPDPAAINLTQEVWETSLDQVFMSGMADLLSEKLGMEVDAGPAVVEADPAVQEWQTAYLQDVRNRMVNTPDSVFREIAADVDKGMAEGDTITDLRDRVAKQLRNTNTPTWQGRAQTVARTESAGAYNATTLEGARFAQRLTGDDTELHQVWVSTLDSKTRRSHAAADGQRAPLGGMFRVGRSELRYPGDPRAPAAETINCRCAVSVLGKDDDLPSEKSRPGRRTIAQWADKGITRARDDSDGIGVASAAPRKDNTMELRTFSALIMPLGVPGRSNMFLVSPDFLLEDTVTPLALKWCKADGMGHDGGVTVGAIEEVEIRDNGLWGSGVMLDTPEADEAVEQIKAGVTQPSSEMVVRNAVATDDKGNILTDEEAEEKFWNDEPMLMRWESGELVGASLVSVPEFRETTITIGDPVDREVEPLQQAIAASAAKVAPVYEDIYKAAAFGIPEADELTEIHIDPDGTVSGHLFPWEACHAAVKDYCAKPYRSQSGYAEFHQSHVRLDNGEKLRVGRLTVGGGHGPVGEGMGPALEHYDNVTTCWALVRATEGEHGLWVSGMVNKQAPENMVRQAATAPHSAHWERVAGYPELIAAHAVNTPGFPLIQKKADRQGDLALVASLFPPRQRRTSYETSILRDAVKSALAEYKQEEDRRSAAQGLISSVSSRRRDRARRIVGRKTDGM